MTKKPKIYCKNCKYSEMIQVFPYCVCRCVKGYKDIPYEEKEIFANIDKDNKNNNCPYFEEKSLWLSNIGTILLALIVIGMIGGIVAFILFKIDWGVWA